MNPITTIDFTATSWPSWFQVSILKKLEEKKARKTAVKEERKKEKECENGGEESKEHREKDAINQQRSNSSSTNYTPIARFRANTTALFMSSLPWVVVRHRLAFGYRRFGPTLSVPSTNLSRKKHRLCTGFIYTLICLDTTAYTCVRHFVTCSSVIVSNFGFLLKFLRNVTCFSELRAGRVSRNRRWIEFVMQRRFSVSQVMWNTGWGGGNHFLKKVGNNDASGRCLHARPGEHDVLLLTKWSGTKHRLRTLLDKEIVRQ